MNPDLPQPPTATDALHAIGLDGLALTRIANRVANDYCRSKAINLGHKHEDFVSHLTEHGLRAAIRYNPQLANGEQGTSFVWKIMENRCEDYFRKKAEGFGDRRYGNDNRIALTDKDEDFDMDIDMDNIITQRSVQRWHQAAQAVDMPIAAYIIRCVNETTDQILELVS